MFPYYNVIFEMPKKTLYKPGQNEAFELSRSKVDLFMRVPNVFI